MNPHIQEEIDIHKDRTYFLIVTKIVLRAGRYDHQCMGGSGSPPMSKYDMSDCCH